MTTSAITFIDAAQVGASLAGRERELIDLAAHSYTTHANGDSRIPHADFLRFPGKERERIIAKIGYLGGARPVCGIKWVASFPDNVANGLPRASALMILNCLETGRPTHVLEGSIISAQRTAASAALAARLLHRKPMARLGVIGCGPINREVVRFILADSRPISSIVVFDIDPERARATVRHIGESFRGPVAYARRAEDVLAACDLVSFATSAVHPSVNDLSMCDPESTLLHVSLRDLSADAVLQADNVVDDIDQVLQENTSVHLAEQRLGRRDFIRATLADVIAGKPARMAGKPSLFSPFGLAVLDLAFAEQVTRHCAAQDSLIGVERMRA